jgi:hypothetical protein
MTTEEKRDAWIAAAVGGFVLVMIYLYLYGGTTQAVVQPPQDTGVAPGLVSPPLDSTPYNYNVTPYSPAAPIQFGFPPPANTNGGCCQQCATANGFGVNVQQFSTLLGTGTG